MMIRHLMGFFSKDRAILKQAKRKGNIIHGSFALKKQMGFFARQPKDVDVFASNPKKCADDMQRRLDKQAGGDHYYAKPSKHESTHKVKHDGFDGIRGTDDDRTVADYTPIPKGLKTVNISGVKYRTVDDIQKSKEISLTKPELSFRHGKDREDLRRIKIFKEV